MPTFDFAHAHATDESVFGVWHPAGITPPLYTTIAPGGAGGLTMSKMEIDLRLENERMAAVIQKLTLEVAVAHEAATGYGEQCDDVAPEPVSKMAAFPARALRHQVQRIGLFVPR
jgi:hypothetical protein